MSWDDVAEDGDGGLSDTKPFRVFGGVNIALVFGCQSARRKHCLWPVPSASANTSQSGRPHLKKSAQLECVYLETKVVEVSDAKQYKVVRNKGFMTLLQKNVRKRVGNV